MNWYHRQLNRTTGVTVATRQNIDARFSAHATAKSIAGNSREGLYPAGVYASYSPCALYNPTGQFIGFAFLGPLDQIRYTG